MLKKPKLIVKNIIKVLIAFVLLVNFVNNSIAYGLNYSGFKGYVGGSYKRVSSDPEVVYCSDYKTTSYIGWNYRETDFYLWVKVVDDQNNNVIGEKLLYDLGDNYLYDTRTLYNKPYRLEAKKEYFWDPVHYVSGNWRP